MQCSKHPFILQMDREKHICSEYIIVNKQCETPRIRGSFVGEMMTQGHKCNVHPSWFVRIQCHVLEIMGALDLGLLKNRKWVLTQEPSMMPEMENAFDPFDKSFNCDLITFFYTAPTLPTYIHSVSFLYHQTALTFKHRWRMNLLKYHWLPTCRNPQFTWLNLLHYF